VQALASRGMVRLGPREAASKRRYWRPTAAGDAWLAAKKALREAIR
jgi:hypothetical protein